MNEKVSVVVHDLGVSAFLLMHLYKVTGKKGSSIYFEVEQAELDKFEELKNEYLLSEFHRFDACLMSLKKMNDRLPKV